jgi:ATP-dependent Lon protease
VTGQIGDVMKESAQIAVSLARAEAVRFGVDIDFEKNDFHIHLPFGSVQKDGPSAGVTILTAIFSWFVGKPIDPTLAMTGEITLRGAIAPVGGIKEKVIAAHRAGIQRVILPRLNEQDLIEVPEEVRSGLQFIFVANVDELMNEAMSLSPLPLSNKEELRPPRVIH